MRRLVVWALCLGVAGAAAAQEVKGPYVGVSAGYFSYEDLVEGEFIDGARFQAPISDSSTAYRLLLGYHLNTNYAIELTYGRADDMKEFLGHSSGALLDIFADVTLKTLRLHALAPFGGIDVIGGIGYYDADVDFDTLLVDGATRRQQLIRGGDQGWTIIGAIQHDFDRITLRGEYEWFDTSGSADAANISVSLLFKF